LGIDLNFFAAEYLSVNGYRTQHKINSTTFQSCHFVIGRKNIQRPPQFFQVKARGKNQPGKNSGPVEACRIIP